MIARFRTLLKVKTTREDLALRALRTKRNEVLEAEQIRAKQEISLKESQDSLGAREEKVYDKIMQRAVKYGEIEIAKDTVLELHKAHQQLEDNLELAIQKCLQLNAELEIAQNEYQIAQRTREKFDNMLGDLIKEQNTRDERAEEAGIEELFTKGRPLPA